MRRPRRSDGEDLLTTGQSARVLGVSRQHIVDLCESGRLEYQLAGTHRRVLRRDIEAVRDRVPGLTRDQQRSLWLHRAVAGKLSMGPARGLDRARRNLSRLREVHPRGYVRRDFDRWQALLDGPLDELLEVLVSRSAFAVELRQNSPFAGVLTVSERERALGAFRRATRAA